MANLQPHVRKHTVVEQVMDRIRDYISSGDLRVGDRIPTEKQLSENFDVGRSSVREAIKVFSYLGILESRTSKGTFISEQANVSTELMTWVLLLQDGNVSELIFLRAAFEIWVIKDIIKQNDQPNRRLSEILSKLRENLSEMERLIKNKQWNDVIRLECNYHHFIFQSNDNKVLLDISNVLDQIICKKRGEETLYPPYAFDAIVECQTAILNTMENNDDLLVSRLYREYSKLLNLLYK